MSCHFLWGIWWKEVRGVGWWIQVAGWAEFWSTNGLEHHGCSCRCWSTRPRGLSGSQSGVVLCWSWWGWFFWAFPWVIVADIENIATHSDNIKNTLKQNTWSFWSRYWKDWPAGPSHCQRLYAPRWNSPWEAHLEIFAPESQSDIWRIF